jgi:hypothetical protein
MSIDISHFTETLRCKYINLQDILDKYRYLIQIDLFLNQIFYVDVALHLTDGARRKIQSCPIFLEPSAMPTRVHTANQLFSPASCNNLINLEIIRRERLGLIQLAYERDPWLAAEYMVINHGLLKKQEFLNYAGDYLLKYYCASWNYLVPFKRINPPLLLIYFLVIFSYNSYPRVVQNDFMLSSLDI